MFTVAFKTLGCRLNRHDSDSLAEQIEAAGHKVVDDMPADFVVVNTCTVTNVADRKSRQTINKFKNASKNIRVIVMGCGPKVDFGRFQDSTLADFVVKSADEVLDILLREKSKTRHVDDLSLDVLRLRKMKMDQNRTRSLVKIQTGCNEFCSYCIVPFTRGRSVSLDKDRIIEDIRTKESEGMKEVVITGINIGDYNMQDGQSGLPDLLRSILKHTQISRIRLSSLNPNHFDDNFYDVFADSRICKHIHLSLQSGSDTILEKMRRRYDRAKVVDVVSRLYAVNSRMAFTGDAIVGFPGENDDDFQDTYDLVKEIAYAHLHVFPYSPKKGTRAAGLPQIEVALKRARATRLRELSQKMQRDFLDAQIGMQEEILVERIFDDTSVVGLTGNYLRLRGSSSSELNEFVTMEIDSKSLLSVG